MVPGERTVTAARRPRQEGGAPHRRLAARRRLPTVPPSTRSSTFDMLHLPIYSDAERIRAADAARRASASRGFAEVHGGPERNGGALRGEALPVLRQLLRVRPLLRGLPRGRDREARARPALPLPLRPLHRLRRLLRQCPCHAIEMIPEPA